MKSNKKREFTVGNEVTFRTMSRILDLYANCTSWTNYVLAIISLILWERRGQRLSVLRPDLLKSLVRDAWQEDAVSLKPEFEEALAYCLAKFKVVDVDVNDVLSMIHIIQKPTPERYSVKLSLEKGWEGGNYA